MRKVKLFIENMLVYGVGGIIGKAIPILMVPIITRMMPDTSYYGISDLANSLISIASAIAILGMYDAMYRVYFDKEDVRHKKSVCTTALFFTLANTVIVFLLMMLFKWKICEIFFTDKKYINLVYISAIAALAGSTNTIVAAPTRMNNERKKYLLINICSPLILYIVAILLLSQKLYLIALPIGVLISSVFAGFFFGVLNKTWFDHDYFDRRILKELLKLAIPLFPNFIIYWVFHSCDRVMIANILGTSTSGIYTVGSKLGSASQLIYTAFAGGWQYFAFSTMNEDRQVETNSRIFEYMSAISFAVGAIIFLISKPLYMIVFTGDYQIGYIVAPYLFMAPLTQMLEQIIGNQFLVVKKAWPTTLILFAGAVTNVVLNYLLIPIIGIEGAAIATLLGYMVSLIICAISLRKMKLLILSPRVMATSVIFILYILIWRFWLKDYFAALCIETLVLLSILLLFYKEEVMMIIEFCKNKWGEKRCK